MLLLISPAGAITSIVHNFKRIIPAVMASDIRKQMMERIYECAAGGKTQELDKLIATKDLDLDAKNERGWTALMFAARNGQSAILKKLLERGSDPSIMNSTGQTALDIASFWNHQDAAKVLKEKPETAKSSEQVINYFGHHILDRAADKRKNPQWISQAMKKSDSKYIIISELRPLTLTSGHLSSGFMKGKGKKLCILSYEDISNFLDSKPTPPLLFLGIEPILEPAQGKPLDRLGAEGIPWFAVDLTGKFEDYDQAAKAFHPEAEFLSADFRSAMVLPETDAAIYAQARSLLDWHARYKFCSTCGSPTRMEESGYKRICENQDCSSLKGVHNTSYPRVDPVVIMLVISQDGRRCLLGRQKRFPSGMFSCLAGFMEPGETMEDAVRRETFEESGVRVGEVHYHSCQPWPFPSTLMIGCHAKATSENIKVDKEEIDDARWFTREEILLMLTGQHKDGFFVPPPQALAHQVIKAWAKMPSNL
ncbi:peroxisomal NADH pyrophosphatase NUDT12 [Lingula anatina]|uniref:NAD-capped RNA hydrolase NUDT12 n=1 Tax=Lingula anatina TaxID=7574 RepID=A0A1S3H0F9_LINAN|nr:peroxisomal NADH pyrophosphatase NUDT12 [Lingula anatina]|eukprot:XP_013379488.1 peroxisomal NADH pyrophosphatase NUDT12 [Lingula anatina]